MSNATPWTAARQASLSFTISQSLLKHWVGDAIQPSHPLLPLSPALSLPQIRVFFNELTLHIIWPKHWSFGFSISPSSEHSELIYSRIDWFCQGKHTDWSHPPWPSTTVTICMSCFMIGGPGKEHGTNKPPPTGRVQGRSKGDTKCPTTSQNLLTGIYLVWAMHPPPGRTVSQKDWPKTTQKLIPSPWNLRLNHVAEQFSWVPLPSCSLPRRPFPIKYIALSAHVSPRTIHFQVLDKSPLSSSGRGPSFGNSLISLQSNGLSRVFSSITIQKHQFFGTQPSLWFKSHIHTRLLEKP